MHILILISSLAFGGAEKQAVEDAKLLSREHKVCLLAFRDGPLKKLLPPAVECIIFPRKDYIRTSFKVASLIRSRKIDLLHAHLYAPMVLSAIAGWMTGKPAIWNFHSHAFENSLKAKLLHKYTSSLPSVKKILFPASELQEYYEYEGYRFKKSKCELAYNSGQQMDTPSPAHESASDKIHIGFIGRIIPLKRVEMLLDLAQYLKRQNIDNFMVDIVGDGPALQNLQQEAIRMGVEPNVTFHGFKSETLSFYRMFGIFAFPSGEEVLSLSLIDAGLAGIPAVAFNVGGNHEIVNEGETGFLVKTPDEFNSRIVELMKSKELRTSLGKAANEQCLAKFSPKARLDYLNKLYAQFTL